MEYQPPESPFPSSAPPPASPQAGSNVSVPAIFLIVVSGIGVAFALWSLISSIVGNDAESSMAAMRKLGELFPEMKDVLDQAASQAQSGAASRSNVLNVLINLFWVATNGLAVFGGIQMLKLKSYGLAMAAAIISIIPCVGPCCCGCAPVGIWALVVLNQPQVKQAFQG